MILSLKELQRASCHRPQYCPYFNLKPKVNYLVNEENKIVSLETDFVQSKRNLRYHVFEVINDREDSSIEITLDTYYHLFDNDGDNEEPVPIVICTLSYKE